MPLPLQPDAAAANSRPAPRVARGDATRSAIIECSMRRFAERGYDASSIDAIAGSAGLTKGALYWHFRNKEELFEAVLEQIRAEWRRQVLARLGDHDDPLDRLRHVFDNYVVLLKTSPQICLFLQRVALDADPGRRRRVRAVYRQTAGFIAGILDVAAERSLLRPGVDTRAAAHAILGALSGCELQCRADERLAFADLVTEIKRTTLRGLQAP